LAKAQIYEVKYNDNHVIELPIPIKESS